jgi:membrane-bound lytic murein transglycosylase A
MRSRLTIGLLALVAAIGCRSGAEKRTKDYGRPLPAGEPALRLIADRSRLPDFTPACRDLRGLRSALRRSLNYLAKPSSHNWFPVAGVSHARVRRSLEEFDRLFGAPFTPAAFNVAIQMHFDVYESVGCDGAGTVLFTGYYTPIFDASFRRTERFRYPLYRPPPGLEKLPDGRPIREMPTRRVIEKTNLYKGNELVYLADPFEAYVAHIQGSARLRLPDGKMITVGYAANNGRPYKSLKTELLRDEKIEKGTGLQGLMAYFREHPGDVTEYTWRNPRFIFFQMVGDDQPRGSLNEPVTPWRSIATDKKIFPRAALTFIKTTLPQHTPAGIQDLPYSGFALDQDAGGAIRAPGRCDVYMGTGEEAGALAGRTQHEGKLYYLLVKE